MTPPGQTSAAGSARTARTPPLAAQPRAVRQRLPGSKVRWDRKFRTIMIVVFALVGWIGLRAAIDMYAADRQANQERAIVQGLTSQNRQLRARKNALGQPATVMRDARQLGMVKAGERSYVVIASSAH